MSRNPFPESLSNLEWLATGVASFASPFLKVGEIPAYQKTLCERVNLSIAQLKFLLERYLIFSFYAEEGIQQHIFRFWGETHSRYLHIKNIIQEWTGEKTSRQELCKELLDHIQEQVESQKFLGIYLTAGLRGFVECHPFFSEEDNNKAIGAAFNDALCKAEETQVLNSALDLEEHLFSERQKVYEQVIQKIKNLFIETFRECVFTTLNSESTSPQWDKDRSLAGRLKNFSLFGQNDTQKNRMESQFARFAMGDKTLGPGLESTRLNPLVKAIERMTKATEPLRDLGECSKLDLSFLQRKVTGRHFANDIDDLRQSVLGLQQGIKSCQKSLQDQRELFSRKLAPQASLIAFHEVSDELWKDDSIKTFRECFPFGGNALQEDLLKIRAAHQCGQSLLHRRYATLKTQTSRHVDIVWKDRLTSLERISTINEKLVSMERGASNLTLLFDLLSQLQKFGKETSQ